MSDLGFYHACELVVSSRLLLRVCCAACCNCVAPPTATVLRRRLRCSSLLCSSLVLAASAASLSLEVVFTPLSRPISGKFRVIAPNLRCTLILACVESDKLDDAMHFFEEMKVMRCT
ncbi:Pentatricopeptide repeat [Sesbania bispinosa]|nr:Pentatricopeptide repeat [Sesbania bispinosa]